MRVAQMSPASNVSDISTARTSRQVRQSVPEFEGTDSQSIPQVVTTSEFLRAIRPAALPLPPARPATEPESKPASVAKRLVLGLGAVCIGLGIPLGVVSIIPLGFAGFAIAGVAALLGLWLLQSGRRMA